MKRLLKIKTWLFYIQRAVKSYKTRESLANIIGKIIGKTEILDYKVLGFEYDCDFTKQLKKNGFVELPVKLSESLYQNIIEQINELKVEDPWHPEFGKFSFSDAPDITHVADYKREELIKIPSIIAIANDTSVLNIVQDFLGATPTISNVNMWWSYAGRKKAEDAQLFHRDVDDLKFCKLFIYLTDVGQNDGPHTYVKGSSSQNKLTKIRRYNDSEINEAFGKENVIYFVRPKCSMFIVDTYGFHKGTLPVDNNRLLLQIQYSLMPIGIEEYKPIKTNKNNNYDKYINRLLIKY